MNNKASKINNTYSSFFWGRYGSSLRWLIRLWPVRYGEQNNWCLTTTVGTTNEKYI